jgi:hypothetical protein
MLFLQAAKKNEGVDALECEAHISKRASNDLDFRRISVRNYENQQSHQANLQVKAGDDDGLFGSQRADFIERWHD